MPPVERTGAEKASTRTHLGVADLSAQGLPNLRFETRSEDVRSAFHPGVASLANNREDTGLARQESRALRSLRRKLKRLSAPTQTVEPLTTILCRDSDHQRAMCRHQSPTESPE